MEVPVNDEGKYKTKKENHSSRSTSDQAHLKKYKY